MSRYKIQKQESLYFVTLTIVDWVDVFIRKEYKDIIIESLEYCQREKGLIVHAFVIMSSHLHLVVKADVGFRLSDILRDFKKFTARLILKEIKEGGYESRREWLLNRFSYRGKEQSNRQYQFWHLGNHPINLYSLPVAAQKVDYIHLNPVKEGWVTKAEEYTYSSASNYALGRGVLAVTLIDFPVNWDGYVGIH